MLIYLDANLNTYLETVDKLDDEEIEAIDNIFLSHRRRHHLVMASRRCLNTLSKIKELSSTTLKQINMMQHELGTLFSIVSKVSTKITVKPSNSIFNKVVTQVESKFFGDYQSENTIFEVPLRYFSNFEMLAETRLVSEHLDDCYLYEYLGREFSDLKYSPFSIKFDRQHGGGNDTYRVFKEKIINNNMVLSLVDSDRKEKGAEIGTTGKRVLEVYCEYKESNIIGCEILPVHEKENLFPSKIYEHFGYNTRKQALEQLRILGSSDVGHVYFPYIDIKDGMSSGNYLPFFEGLFDIENLIPKTYEGSRGFENEFYGTKEEFLQYFEEQQKMRKSERVNKYLIEPLSSNPLSNFKINQVIEKLEQEISSLTQSPVPQNVVEKKQEKLKILKNLSIYLLDYQNEYFEIIGTKINEWGLSNHKPYVY